MSEELEEWRQEQLKKMEANPEEGVAAIRQVLGDELFEKVFGKDAPKAPQVEPPKAESDVSVLDVLERVNRVPKVIEKAVEPLSTLPFIDAVKEHVVEEIAKLPVSERANLSDEDIIGYTRLAAGYLALHQMLGGKTEEKTEPEPEPEPQTEPTPTVPDYLKGRREDIMAMKDALLAHGYTEAEIEAMARD